MALKQLETRYISTDQQTEDVLTKSLLEKPFSVFFSKLGVATLSSSKEGIDVTYVNECC